MPANSIRISVQLQPVQATYASLSQAVDAVEDLGVDGLYNSDHFFPVYGPPDGPCFEAWTLLAAWAQQTTNVELGVSVSGNSYRNPNLLADMARTVDHISAGRVVLGIGSGWFKKDYEEYGFPLPAPEQRLQELTATLETIEKRMPLLNPPPVRKIPILIGNGGDRKPPKLVARFADRWLDFKGVDEVQAYNEELDLACEHLGRDSLSIERGIALAPTDLEHAEAYRAAGCTHFMLRFLGPDFDLRPVTEWVDYRDKLNN